MSRTCMRNPVARWMSRLALLAIPCLLASCLPVPLGDPAKSKVDPALKGFWRLTSGEKNMLIVIAPFDEHAYIMDAVGFTMDKDTPRPESHFAMKGWLTDVKGKTFLTTEFARQIAGTAPDEERAYPTFKISIKGDQLTAQMLSEKFFDNVKTSDDLEKIVSENVENEKMYDSEATYQRLDPAKDKEFINAALGK